MKPAVIHRARCFTLVSCDSSCKDFLATGARLEDDAGPKDSALGGTHPKPSFGIRIYLIQRSFSMVAWFSIANECSCIVRLTLYQQGTGYAFFIVDLESVLIPWHYPERSFSLNLSIYIGILFKDISSGDICFWFTNRAV